MRLFLRLFSEPFLGIVFLCLSTVACAQKEQNFITLTNAFSEEYQTLNIPPLQLSYVQNLESVSSEEDLKKQEDFFNRFEKKLQSLNQNKLSGTERVVLEVIKYETDLNRERISLSRSFQKADKKVHKTKPDGDRIFDRPLGKAWYAYFLKKWTDREADPDSVYQFGLRETERVKGEIEKLRHKLNMDEKTFRAYLEKDVFRIKEKGRVREKYLSIQSKVREQAKHFFPDTDKVPLAEIAPGENAELAIAPAYYSGGTFYYNFFGDHYNAKAMPWTFMHEAVPGHHYQIFLDEKEEKNPVLDLFSFYSFIEGWGAYVEQFGYELGAISEPAEYYGQLEWDLIRSARVVMDVGLNYYGWSDEQALEFWNRYLSDKDDIAKREIARMKRWPAQVVSYKYGKKILDDLKGKKTEPAELKAFHTEVLAFGDLPLSVLKRRLEKEEKAREEQEAIFSTRLNNIDAAVNELYAVISGAKGETRNTDFLRFMFRPEARLGVVRKIPDGNTKMQYLSIEDYIQNSIPWMLQNGFYEKEMKRKVNHFGNMAQVFSSYECFHSLSEEKPFMRGINCIQFVFDGSCWKVAGIFFEQESLENPIPGDFEK